MPRYRHALPQLNGQPVLADGGLETVLIFHEGIDLPEFASFPIIGSEEGRALVSRYFDRYAAIARRHGVALLLEAPTWRANPDWVERVTGAVAETADINRRAIDHLTAYRVANADLTTVISGCVGPRCDGYAAKTVMSDAHAEEYHSAQVGALADSEADLISALTLNYVDEAIGVARAAAAAQVPCAVSFTLETDGRLPTGQPLGEAIHEVDEATNSAPAYYMVNCAHPVHFDAELDAGAAWIDRLRGLRANASMLSHAELDKMTVLDDGDPADLGRRVGALFDRLPALSVLGGCCGSDHRHIAAIAEACFPASRA